MFGCVEANCSIGLAYGKREGVERDRESKHYYELVAMGGGVVSRYNLRNMEFRAGNNICKLTKENIHYT